MNSNIAAALIGAVVLIVLTILGATWRLAILIGTVRLEISGVRAEAVKNDVKVDSMWHWWTSERPCGEAPRPCRVPLESTHQQ